ncbi:MAG TPA: type II toxin-antitoxin system RelE/ParE family toxin [Thermomicrobiales bacterium]|jgi:hypothetical protein
MAWEVEYTNEFGDWFAGLDESSREDVIAAVELLETEGPTLGRPLVDTLTGSRYAKMKELRPQSSNLRILFMFDPRRTAILLIGGDKSGRWQAWYREMIPVAERLYEEYLQELEREGFLP